MRGFHDTLFGDAIDIGLHAVAVDEKRRPFAPTFWTIKEEQTLPDNVYVEQVWFPGAHSNVGGGYPEAGLSDHAFRWMIARVEALGRDHFKRELEFDYKIVERHSAPDAGATLYRSEKWWPISRFFPYRRPLLPGTAIDVRAIAWNGEKRGEAHINERIYWSVCDRLERGGVVEGQGHMPYTIQFYKQPGRVRTCNELPPGKIAQRTSEELPRSSLAAR